MRNGTGSIVTFSGFSAEILDINGPDTKRDKIDTTHMATAGNYRTSMPKKFGELGTLRLQVAFDGELPLFTDPGACSIRWGEGSGAKTWSFTAYMSNHAPKAPLEDKMTADIELTLTTGPS